jgi:hypothetical protein
MFKLLLSICLLSISLSAFEVGHAFHQQNKDKLVIDKTTLEEVYKYFGKPEKDIVTKNHNGEFRILEYYFIHSGFSDGDMKVLLIELKDDVLIAYIYDSSHGDDATLFNQKEADNVKIGHKFMDVAIKVGTPSGEAICPVNIHKYKDKCVNGKNMKVWIYSPGASMFSISDMQTHIMFVGINDEGVILEVYRELHVGDDL